MRLLLVLVAALVVGAATSVSSGMGSKSRRAVTVRGWVAYSREGGWITVADLEGAARRVITSPLRKGESRFDYDPVWSPDGSQFAFVRTGSNGALYVAKRDGSGLRRLLRVVGAGFAPEAVDYPSWSPDGRRLAYGNGPLYVVNTDGAGSRKLLASSTCNPVWSPDGNGLLYLADAEPCQYRGTITPAPGYRSIYRIDADGAHRRLLASGSFGDAAWSPDGGQIAYTANCEVRHGADWSCSVFLMNADGSGKHRLVNSTFGDGQVEWAGGGTEVLWPNGSPAYPMSATNLSTGRTHKLVPPTVSGMYLAGMSKDGRRIALATWDNEQIVLVSLSGRLLRRVTVPRGWKYESVSVFLP